MKIYIQFAQYINMKMDITHNMHTYIYEDEYYIQYFDANSKIKYQSIQFGHIFEDGYHI